MLRVAFVLRSTEITPRSFGLFQFILELPVGYFKFDRNPHWDCSVTAIPWRLEFQEANVFGNSLELLFEFGTPTQFAWEFPQLV